MRELRFAGHEGKSITLAGRAWVMADLAPRQFRKVIPAVLGLSSLQAVCDIDEARLDRLLDAFYHALTRNYPDLTREEFLDLPIKVTELIAGLPALAAAAGIEPSRGGHPAGKRMGRRRLRSFRRFTDLLRLPVARLELGRSRRPAHGPAALGAQSLLGAIAAAPIRVDAHRGGAGRVATAEPARAGGESLAQPRRACRRSGVRDRRARFVALALKPLEGSHGG